MTADVECPGCGETSFDESFDVVDQFCENCGAVVPDVEDVEELPSIPEYDSFDQDSGAGSMPDSWTDWYSVSNSTEQRVATAFEYLETIANSLDLSTETRIRGAELYSDASIELATDGRSSEATVAALLYLATRDNQEPRPVSTFSQVIERDDSEIKSLARSLQRELKLELPIPQPKGFLPYLAAELDYADEVRENARDVISEISEDEMITGKNPVSIAGAALYREGDQHSQRDIAQAAGVTKETIRKRLNEIENHLDEQGPVQAEGIENG